MVKIVHIADCHIDTPFNDLPDSAAAHRRQVLRDCFMNAVKSAAEDKADMVLISGDLFDNSYATPASARLLQMAADNFPALHIFVSPGNHDCLFGQSVYKTIEKRDNLHIFDSGEIQKFELIELDTVVYGVGCLQPRSDTSPLSGFWVEDKSKINIMCLHALLAGYGGHDSYNPITPKQVQDSGLDYLALGHVHAYSGINKVGDTYYAYPGCIAGRGFDECGDKGYIKGSIGKEKPHLEFVKSKCASFECVNADISGAQSMNDILDAVGTAVAQKDKNTFLKIVLKGRRPADLNINGSVIAGALADFAFVRVRDETTLDEDIEKLAGEQTLKGLFVKKLLEGNFENEQIRSAAISAGLAALNGEEFTYEDF